MQDVCQHVEQIHHCADAVIIFYLVNLASLLQSVSYVSHCLTRMKLTKAEDKIEKERKQSAECSNMGIPHNRETKLSLLAPCTHCSLRTKQDVRQL